MRREVDGRLENPFGIKMLAYLWLKVCRKGKEKGKGQRTSDH